MRNNTIKSILILVSLCAFYSFAQNTTIYKTTHKDGTVTYSDQPSPGAVQVSLDVNTNTMQSNAPKMVILPQVTQKKREYQLNIVSPENDATVRNNMGNIDIAASLQPSHAGLFQLTINGQKLQSPTGVFKLENMDRGSYQYQVEFIGNSGKVIASSETRSLHLHRASALIN